MLVHRQVILNRLVISMAPYRPWPVLAHSQERPQEPKRWLQGKVVPPFLELACELSGSARA